MRTKRFWLLAAVLLSSVCATFAQSGNKPQSIIGEFDAQGEDYYNSWAVENWSASIKKDASDQNKVWIYNFTPAGFPDAIYGIVNDDKTEIRIPVNQAIGSNSSYDAVLEAYTNEGNDDITDFIVGTISEDGTITITPTTWIAAAAYNKGTTTLAGYYAVDRAVVFKKKTVPMSGIFLNAENFPDANFRAALADIFGIYDGDELSTSHIVGMTVLDVSRKSIADLTGIEHFTALTELWCDDNQLTSLDVSNNTALTELWCGGNQLTSLDVSKNTALTWLYCYGNQLTSLDVSKNTALTWLECAYNQLTSLDVSKNTALTKLSCYNNQLTLLDVSKNAALTHLSCSGNQLTSLDVSKNAALTHLSCSGNQLTSLDVSKHTALTTLYCNNNPLTSLNVTKDAVLTKLDYSYTQLTSFDLSKHTALEYLGCSGNQLPSLDVSKHTALTRLYCSSNQLTSLDVSKNTALEWLQCSNNQLKELDVSKNTSLELLACAGNNLSSLDFSQNKALNFVHCHDNRLKGKAMDNLVESLPKVQLGTIMVVDIFNENEANVCTKSQVAAAKEKGWNVTRQIEDCSKDYESLYYGIEYEGSEDPEQEINPVDEDDNIDYGSDMDENSDLDGNVIGDIFYNISSGNGEYNSGEGCIVITKPTDDGTVNDLEGKDIFGEDFKSQFTGIVFKVPAGKGTIKVNAETTGNMLLKVKIGSNEPVEMELVGKLKISFPYNVSEETRVYIFAGAANEAKGFGKTSSTESALKIYGIEFLRDETPTDIDASLNDNGEMTNDSWYSIDGVKLSGEPTKKGLYIRNGKKVVK